MLLSCSEMRALEERAFTDGITAAALMEEAGERIACAVQQFFPEPEHCLVFFGKGHNGGDALVAARYLADAGWHIDLRAIFSRETWSPLTARQHAAFVETSVTGSSRFQSRHCPSTRAFVILDGLLGIGAGGALREPIRSACGEINRLRCDENAHVFALDLPTGLDGDSGAADADAVRADFTLTIGFTKNGLVADSAINHVGRLAVLPLAELTRRAGALSAANVESENAPRIIGVAPDNAGQSSVSFSPLLATAGFLASLLKRRAFDTHKGACGRVGIIAGSLGFTGAPAMCAEAAVRGGAGLVTLYVPADVHAIVAARAAPEVMVQPLKNPLALLDAHHDVLALGPGLGRAGDQEILELIIAAPQPMILDADALNLLADHPAALERCLGPRLLTPHPGEMARLDPGAPLRPRRETVEKFTREHTHTLLLKGARSLIGQRDRPLSYNTTGHPGLASGGIGDVLTGLLAALVAQGHTLYDAAQLGSWLIGRAAELAVYHGEESAESLRATAVLGHLGSAFEQLRARCY